MDIVFLFLFALYLSSFVGFRFMAEAVDDNLTKGGYFVMFTLGIVGVVIILIIITIEWLSTKLVDIFTKGGY